MKKIILPSLLVMATISTNLFAYVHFTDKLDEAEKMVIQLQDDIVTKSTEIARLDDTIKKNYEIMTEKDEAIKQKDDRITELLNRIRKLEEEKKKQAKMIQVSRGEQKKKAIYMEATAYVSDCEGCIGITKTGINVKNTINYNGYRIIAVDKRIVPLNSIVKVKTKKETFYAIAGDIGGAIKGYEIDILVNNENEAFKFGRQVVEVTIMN